MFSFIIPTYNRAEQVMVAIQSVENAEGFTPSDVEIIVVDDCSSDHTVDELCRLGTRISLLVLHKNMGVNVAKNCGVAIARGQYCVFLDSDDELTKDGLKVVRDLLRNQPEIAVLFGACRSTDGRDVSRGSDYEGKKEFREMLSVGSEGEYLPIVRTDIIKFFPFETSVRGFEGLTWLRIARDGHYICYSARPIRIYNNTGTDRMCHPDNLRRDAERLARGFILKWKIFDREIACEVLWFQVKLLVKTYSYARMAGIAKEEWPKPMWNTWPDRLTMAVLRSLFRSVPAGVLRWAQRHRFKSLGHAKLVSRRSLTS